MPKSTIVFNLPEEQEEFFQSLHAHDAFSVISHIIESTRQMLKHEDLTEDQVKTVERIRKTLFQSIEDREISNLL